MKLLNKIYNKAFNNKYWRNIGEFCDRKYHPLTFHYRRYRRGKNRCLYCGAKIGERKLKRQAAREMLLDNIYTNNTMLSLLKKRGAIV